MCQRCVCVDLTWRRSTEYNRQKWRRSLQGSAERKCLAMLFAECSCPSPCHIRHWSKLTFMCALAASVLPRGASYCRTLNLGQPSRENPQQTLRLWNDNHIRWCCEAITSRTPLHPIRSRQGSTIPHRHPRIDIKRPFRTLQYLCLPLFSIPMGRSVLHGELHILFDMVYLAFADFLL
jgi:hypothetical protein